MASEDTNESEKGDNTKTEPCYAEKDKDVAGFNDISGGNEYPTMKNAIPVSRQGSYGLDFMPKSTEEPAESEVDVDRNRKVGRRITGCALATVILIILTVLSIIVIPMIIKSMNSHIVKYKCEKASSKLNVVVDKQKETIFVLSTTDKIPEDVQRMHDYKTKMMAFRHDLVCYVTSLDEKFEEGQLRWKYHKDVQQTTPVSYKKIGVVTLMVMRHIGGEDIAKLCSDTRTVYWIKEAKITVSI